MWNSVKPVLAKYSKLYKWVTIAILVTLFYNFLMISYGALAYKGFYTSSDYINLLIGANIVKTGNIRQLYDLESQKEIYKTLMENKIRRFHFYNKEYQIELLPFRLLPTTAVSFVPFTLFNPFDGYKLFYLINVGIVPLAGLVLYGKNAKKYMLFMLFMYAFKPYVLALFLGQPIILSFLGFALAYKALISKKEKLTGILMSVLILKPHHLLISFLVGTKVKEKPVYYKYLLTSVTIILILNLIIFGLDLPLKYLAFNKLTEGPAYVTFMEVSLSLLPFLKLLLTDNLLVTFIANVAILATVFPLITRRCNKLELNEALVVLISTGLLFGFHTHQQDLLLLAVPFFELLYSQITKRQYTLLFAIIIGYCIVMYLNIYIYGLNALLFLCFYILVLSHSKVSCFIKSLS